MKKLAVPEYIEQRKEEDPDGKLWDRYSKLITDAQLAEVPAFPRVVMVEVANICNHKCSFCAYTKMTRPSQYISPELFRRVMTEAYELGAREVGLHGGSEPLTCKKLEEHIAHCKELGYEYIYFSTNGALGSPERFRKLIDAGTSSIKFSVNGGDREAYKAIHGKDDFDKVIEIIKSVDAYRKEKDIKLYLSVSFVEVPENAASFANLKELMTPYVDEVFHVHASNQSGQMLNLPISPYQPETCQIPFNQVNISREGHLRACCNDYQNALALEDLAKMSLKDAWASARFRDLRRRHIEDKLEGTLCYTCIKGVKADVKPIAPELGDWGTIE